MFTFFANARVIVFPANPRIVAVEPLPRTPAFNAVLRDVVIIRGAAI